MKRDKRKLVKRNPFVTLAVKRKAGKHKRSQRKHDRDIGSVDQWLDQPVFTRQVEGSSPSSPTISKYTTDY